MIGSYIKYSSRRIGNLTYMYESSFYWVIHTKLRITSSIIYLIILLESCQLHIEGISYGFIKQHHINK